ncbi:membrane protein insertion efficiency factor YidD [Candidatus Nomurabacteria bacterium]|nr:membrane protein insertion efficiency factor YidD [Candidatus Nomurabacteria bacterium]
MKKLIISLINFYQSLRGVRSRSCVFEPTCSQYTKEAIIKYGVLYGILKGIVRILRCHPWQKNHYDPLR